MKFRFVAAAALMICSLYGCGNNNASTTSLYTPAPVTPRPTFSTSRYITKEEMTAKKDQSFVIASKGVDTQNSYPSKEEEFDRIYEEEKPKTSTSVKTSASTNKNVNISYSSSQKQNVYVGDNQNSDEEYMYAENAFITTPEPQLTPRPAYAVPSGFSSKNYPYSVYSHDGSRYLGDITMNPDNENSIWNQDGEYGSPDSTTSIYNTYGIYGSSNSMFSAFNDYATAPPKIYDSKGNQVGLLSSNLIHTDGISPDELKAYVEKNGL